MFAAVLCPEHQIPRALVERMTAVTEMAAQFAEPAAEIAVLKFNIFTDRVCHSQLNIQFQFFQLADTPPGGISDPTDNNQE